MTRRRFYAPPICFAPDGASLTLSADESRHLRDVLRLQAGDEALVFDGEGAEFLCVVRDEGGRKARRDAGGAATLEVRARVAARRPESPLDLTMGVALLKGEKFDLVVQKATELGVSRIIPVETKRAEMRLSARDEREAARRKVRWQRLALEAAKQSGRARLPSIEEPRSFAALLAAPRAAGEVRLMFAERDGHPLREAIDDGGGDSDSGARIEIVTALVGPEGGWEDDEITEARGAGWALVTLGGRTLRAETAAVVVAVLLQHLCGDLR